MKAGSSPYLRQTARIRIQRIHVAGKMVWFVGVCVCAQNEKTACV